jgi:hypothetical protein
LKAVYGLYPDADSAERAFLSLHAAAAELGFNTDAVAVLSSEPFEEQEFTVRVAGTPMTWVEVLGGLIGGLSGYALTALTQRAYPLPTGGMVLAPPWTDGIIIYELTMLGAILATLLTLFVSAPLPAWRRQLYDPEISTGKILVGVVNPPETSRVELEGRLRKAGAQAIKEFS